MLVPRTPVTPVASPTSRGLLCHRPATIGGSFGRQGGAVISCCAKPNDKAKKKTSAPTPSAQTFHVKGGAGGVHFHLHGAGQATEWDAVPISPEAKALLQKHTVKASTALKMHAVLGFEDVADLQHLSPGLVSQLELRPLQLEPLVRLLGDWQQQQQQQQDKDMLLLADLSQAQDQQQHNSQAQLAGHATPPGDEPALPAMQQAADSSPPSTDLQQDAGKAALASVWPAAKAGAPPAAPAARAAPALPGTGGRVRYPRPSGGGLHRHACVAVMEGKAGTINSVAITPDGRRVVTAGPGSKVHVWDLQARTCIATMEGHGGDVLAVAVSPDGRCAISRSDNGALRLWDLGTYACTASLVVGTRSPALAITPDGRHALYGDGSRLFKWTLDQPGGSWEVGRCAEVSEICCIAVTPDGRLAVTGGSYDRLRVWDLDGATQVGALGNSRPFITSLAITPDGSQLVSAGSFGSSYLNVWDLARRTCTGAMKGAVSAVTCLAISPDGRWVVSGSRRGCSLRVWDLATRSCTGVMFEPEGTCWYDSPAAVECVAITPDGRYAVSGGRDLRVWDLDLGPEPAPTRWPAALQRLSGVVAAAAAAVGLK